MSNPTSRVDLSGGLSKFLTDNNLLVQKKKNRDPQTTPLPDGQSNGRATAEWGDLVDDFMLALMGAEGLLPFEPTPVSTTDATPTVLDTVTLEDDKVTRITWRVVGRVNGSNDDAVYGEFTARYIDDGGVSALWDIESSTPADYSPSATLTTANISVAAPSGQDVVLSVIGEAATNIDWQAKRIVEEFF